VRAKPEVRLIPEKAKPKARLIPVRAKLETGLMIPVRSHARFVARSCYCRERISGQYFGRVTLKEHGFVVSKGKWMWSF